MTLDRIPRNREGLIEALEQVDREGWNGPEARLLLTQVRHSVVVPLVASIGFRGVAAEQAIATGWAVAWEVLKAPSTRGATSPWGVIWVAVRRALLNEQIAGVYATAPRTAWRLAAAEGERGVRPVSLEVMRAAGWEPTERPAVGNGKLLSLIVDLLVEAGWGRPSAEDVVQAVAQAAPWGPGQGWRWIANRVDAEPWQVRRLIEFISGEDVDRPADRTAQFSRLLHYPAAGDVRRDLVERLARTTTRRGCGPLANAG